MTNVLYLYGGWPGHSPYNIAEWTRELVVGELGFDMEESQDIFTLDRDLTGYDLIVLGWNNALTTEDLSDSRRITCWLRSRQVPGWRPGTVRRPRSGRACATT